MACSVMSDRTKFAIFLLLCASKPSTGARRISANKTSGVEFAQQSYGHQTTNAETQQPRIWLAVSPDVPQGDGIPFCTTPNMQQCSGILPWGMTIEGDLEGGWLKHGRTYLPMKMSRNTVLKAITGQQWRCVWNTPVKVFRKPDLKQGSATSELIQPGQQITVLELKDNGELRWMRLGPDRWVPYNRPDKEGSGILFHRLDVLPYTIIGNDRKSITVVGCGIAGIVTALELAMRPDVGQITVMDREKSCAAGTSGRIAAEMMFYNFHRDLFNKGEYWFDMTWQKIWKAQASAHQSAWGKLWDVYKSASAAKGQRKTVKCDTTCLRGVRYMWSPFGAPVVAEVSDQIRRQGWPLEGDIMASIDGRTAHHIWETVKGWDEIDDAIRHSQVNRRVQGLLGKKSATLTFQRGGDVRMLEPFQAAFFEQAAENMKRLVKHYPALCEAVITPACCEFHSATVRQNHWGYGCDRHLDVTVDKATGKVDPGMGMAEVFMTRNTEFNAKAKGWMDNAHDFEIWNSTEVQSRLKTFINSETQYGAAVNRVNAGFVRTEDLGRVFQDILASKGHNIMLDTELTGSILTDNGQVVLEHQQVFHDWQYNANNILELQGWRYGQRSWHTAHGVVVCTGATPKAVARMDQDIQAQLIPAFGNIVVGPPDKVPEEERRMGVVLEEYHMYLRSSKDGRLAVGGGVWMSWSNDNAVRSLPYKDKYDVHGEFWGISGDDYMRQARIGQWLVDHPLTVRKGGARPMSYFVNFPLIKMHPWAPVVFNSGGGVNGFSISWKSGQIAADLVLNKQVLAGTGVMWQGRRSWSFMRPKTSGSFYIPSREWEVIADESVKVYVRKEKANKSVIETLGKGSVVYGYSEDGIWLAVRGHGGAVAYMPIKDFEAGRELIKSLV